MTHFARKWGFPSTKEAYIDQDNLRKLFYLFLLCIFLAVVVFRLQAVSGEGGITVASLCFVLLSSSSVGQSKGKILLTLISAEQLGAWGNPTEDWA